MGIGEHNPVGAGDEAGSLALLLLNGGPAAKQAPQGIHQTLQGVDPHHRGANLSHGIGDHVAAARKHRSDGGITDTAVTLGPPREPG